MTSFLPRLEDTLVDLLQYGDTGALRVSVGERRWDFYVQGGVLIGMERTPRGEGLPDEPNQAAVTILTEAMRATGALWEFDEGAGPDDFGLYDARRALVQALGRAREAPELLRALQPVLDGWPEINVDPDTLTGDTAIQAWLETLDGLGPGSEKLVHAPSDAGPALGALWVAWKLGDLDLHTGAVEDEDFSDIIDDEDSDVSAPLDAAAEDNLFTREETAEREEETAATWQTDGPMDSRKILDEIESGVRTVRQDPFIAGVAKARSGQPLEALPLLERAFAEDPERPGLEEWLGYTQFAAHRDDDGEAAKRGLTMLREVMYRTGPTGDTPILPWILMARAQFERGDLVQARSLLDSVLEREPDDPEAMHLDGLLKRSEADVEKMRETPEGVSLGRIFAMTGGVALMTVIVLALQVIENRPPPRTDYGPEVAEIMPMRELHRVPKGFVGVVLPEWEGLADPTTVSAGCRAVAAATHMDDAETLLLLSAEGVPLTECGQRLR